ncbi:MAG: RluA family pseudouridine synthase [Bacilli bacterium]|nr:RluA family pseudouridine synthase [Bacilli bacterium]
MKEVVVPKASAGQKAEKFVRKYLSEAPLGFIYKAFRKKDVKVNGHWVNKDFVLSEGDVVRVYVTDQQLEDFRKPRPVDKKMLPYPIAYEDDAVLIINKPKGLLVYGDATGVRETLGNAVLDYLAFRGEYDPNSSSFTPSPAHRLDRNTSGLVVYGKTDAALRELTLLFKERTQIEKRYLALVLGNLEQDGEIALPLWKDATNGRVYVRGVDKGGKEALTRYHIVHRYGAYTLVEAELVTGRTHQIRVHFSAIGHPLVGDEKYGDFASCREVKRLTGLESQLLHAYKLTFKNVSGPLAGLKGKTIEASLPLELEKAIGLLTASEGQ